MMEHEDGYCDQCGAEVDVVQLDVDGRELCDTCVRRPAALSMEVEAIRGAYDDGR